MPPRIRRRRVGGTSWASREADRLWSAIVRSAGACYLADRAGHVCAGPLQAAHGFSRRYRVTRWNLLNGFPLCAGAHVFYTHEPLGWDDLLREWWGAELYHTLRKGALSMEKMDPRAILEDLRSEAARLGLAA